MSFEYSSIKMPLLNRNMFGGADDELKSADNIVVPTTETLTSIPFLILYVLLGVALLYIVCSYFNGPVYEGMSGGTLTQLFAQDAQDVNLKGNVDQLATGNFNLFWNQPSRISQGTQRGTPLPKIRLPHTSMNPNLNESNTVTENKPSGGCTMNCNKKSSKLDALPEATCTNDVASCGNGYGGSRLGSGFVNATDDPRPFVGLNGTVNYPDSYLGSMYISPQPDPMKPLKVMQPLNTQTYVREGYE
mgnify:CR=1 FL=1